MVELLSSINFQTLPVLINRTTVFSQDQDMENYKHYSLCITTKQEERR